MNSDTPAIDINIKHRLKNVQALAGCLKRLKTMQLVSCIDIRYGTGLWAKCLADSFPGIKIYGFEADPVTAKLAYVPSGSVLKVARYSPDNPLPKGWPYSLDLLMADYNNLTAFKKEPIAESLAQLQPRIAIFTDVASAKLHLNYKTYGLARNSLEDYWAAFDLRGYKLLGWTRAHFFASTSVWMRAK